MAASGAVTEGDFLVMLEKLSAAVPANALQSLDFEPGAATLKLSVPDFRTLDQIKADAESMGELTMVLVDTSVSFFSGDNENDNQQAYDHARYLRALSMLPGKPAVVVNCHPSASAGKDHSRESFVPRGGSAFMNEIDTNLTVWSEGGNAEFHWMAKKRGPDFSPILFEYKELSIRQHGVAVPTVVAVHIDEDREKEIRLKRKQYENRLLYVMLRNPDGTIREWAYEAGFTI
jgi:hypothetical protein